MSNICEICGEVFDNGRIKSNHVRWKHKNNKKYLSKLPRIAIEREIKKYGKFKKFDVICANPNCNKKFQVKEREKLFPKKEKYFCCIGCANRRIHNEEIRNKIGKAISITLKEKWKDPEFASRQFKSNKSITQNKGKRRFTSKGEEEVRNYFMNKYPDDGWTFGGHLIQDGVSLIRDLYSNKLKICVEYNGIWHYKDINGQLKEKQLKDKKLKKWCRLNGYQLIVIKDDDYRKNKNKILELLERKIYENNSFGF